MYTSPLVVLCDLYLRFKQIARHKIEGLDSLSSILAVDAMPVCCHVVITLVSDAIVGGAYRTTL